MSRRTLPGMENRSAGFVNTIRDVLSSVKLAIALLIIILACCVAGVTLVRGVEAGALIFGTIWFNGLLVLLVVNVAFCFFPRMWGRKLTLASFGMILFHLSFVVMLAGVVYNSFLHFHGSIRLTEGERLASGEPESYDDFEKGRYFNFSRLRGETMLVRMQRGYKLSGDEKQVAYDVAVGEPGAHTRGIIYTTHKLHHDGVDYFRDREGYSLTIVLLDRRGRELYGAAVPLQSLQQKDGAYLYTTGTKTGPGYFPFPQGDHQPLFLLKASFVPSRFAERDREGDAKFSIEPLPMKDQASASGPRAEGTAAIGSRVKMGEYSLLVPEVRYWVVMSVRYDPGKPIVLTSLWFGLGGMILTFIGRMRRQGA